MENRTLRLAAWLISGNPQQQTKFHQQLPHLSQMPDQKALKEITDRPGESLVAGVVGEKWIRFLVI